MTQGSTKGVPIDTDPTLGLNSDQVVPSQAAVVTYVGVTIASNALPVTATENQVLLSNNLSAPEWSSATYPSTVATGDVLFASGINALTTLTAGADGEVLTLASGIPSWSAPTTGTVESVSGTADRITIGGTAADPIVDIASTYVGQTSVVTLGTIATGTWEATDVAVAHGGSGRSTATAYAVICGGTTGTGAQQSIAGVGTSGQVLTSNGISALPTFQDAAVTVTEGDIITQVYQGMGG